jgi:hypothetical protein
MISLASSRYRKTVILHVSYMYTESILSSFIQDEFTGYSCLLVTWKTNPEVEQFKVTKTNTNREIKLV